VKREEATEALALLRRVVKEARDEAALQNWGPVWIAHAFTNGGAFVATDVMVRRLGTSNVWPYAGFWTAVVIVNFLAILLLKRGGGGVRTFIENQVWLIWTSFIGAAALICILNWVMGTDRIFAGVAMGVMTAYGFAMMGGVMGRRWFAWTALYAAGSAAMAFLPQWQFTILGALYAVSQLTGGIWLMVEKRRMTGARVV
jgi:hypothetical protein